MNDTMNLTTTRFPREAMVTAPLGAEEKDGMEPEENSGRGTAEGGSGRIYRAQIRHVTPSDTLRGAGRSQSIGANQAPSAGGPAEVDGPASESPLETNATRLIGGADCAAAAVADGQPRSPGFCSATADDLREAQEKELACQEFERLVAGGYSLNQAAVALGRSVSWFSGAESPYVRWQRGGLAGLLPQRRARSATGNLTAEIETLKWFIPAARFFNLILNRTSESGSVPEAVRRVVSLPELPVGWTNAYRNRFLKAIKMRDVPVCPAELREKILARELAGQALVTERVARQIAVSKVAVWQHRRPHEAGLRFLQAPGSSMVVRRNGEAWIARAGDILESDDGTINLPVCIPWRMADGSPITESVCARKYGVIVGRFQWLRSIDVGSRFRPGWVFVARPRSSYRGADVLTLLRGLTVEHGIWDQYRFERGVWKSDLVSNAIKMLGADHKTVFSPHSKPFVEGGFSQDWLKLSAHFPWCDLGRYRGDTEECNRVLQACRAGAQDPRRLFPMLKDVMAAFDAITREENGTPVNSRNHGRWVPEERWADQVKEQPLRRIEERNHFMFAPVVMERKVNGMMIGGRVPVFEDLSVPFDFTAPWLCEFHGARLRLHFDPSAPNCLAVPVLMEAWGSHKAGEVLGQLTQINEITGYIRTVLGWGDDAATAGLKAKQQAAAALRREVRTILPKGGSGYAESVEHDGVSRTSKVESSGEAKESRVQLGGPEPAVEESDDDLDAREREVGGTAIDYM